MAKKHRGNLSEVTMPGGFVRVKIAENGRVVGDSGWTKNQITNTGARYYLVENLAGETGSRRATHMSLGTGTAPNATHETMQGELASRVTVNFTVSNTRTARFTAQFASSVFSTQGAQTIQNVGLFNTSSGGTIFAGTNYTTSQWNSNQDVNVTYEIRFP